MNKKSIPLKELNKKPLKEGRVKDKVEKDPDDDKTIS